MINTPAELTALIDANHITLHTRMFEVWKDRPPIEVVDHVRVGDIIAFGFGSSTQPHEHHALLPRINAAIASASAHDRLKIEAELEKIRAGGLGSVGGES